MSLLSILTVHHHTLYCGCLFVTVVDTDSLSAKLFVGRGRIVCCGAPKMQVLTLLGVSRASSYDHSQGLCGMEGKSGDSRSCPIEQETQLALYWLIESPFYTTSTWTTRLGYTLLVFNPSQHIGNEAGGNPCNNKGESLSNDRTWANEPGEGNTGPALHLTPTCLPWITSCDQGS